MGKKDSIFERYKILVSARNFHYENFNKWMTYFYVATGAIFIGYVNLIDQGAQPSVKIECIIISLGYITSLLLFWSSKGYYHWNINFITLVNHYEKELLDWKKKERIYSVHANKNRQNKYLSPFSGANISTSKVAILFAFIITNSWGTLFIYTVSQNYISCSNNHYLNCCNETLLIIISFFISILITTILGLFVKVCGKDFIASNIEPLDDLKLTQPD